MKRYLILLALPALACSTLSTPLPSTPTSAPVTQTSISPTNIPNTSEPTTVPNTSEPTTIPDTNTPSSSNATTFPDPSGYVWQQIITGLRRPTDLRPDGSGRLFVVEKAGRIRIIQDGQLLQTPFLDITDRVGSSGNEQGLLGLVFHPQYVQNGRFFVNYTDKNGNTVIARFQVSSDPNVADENSEVKLLGVHQPYQNHNGGSLMFGPDGYLYAGLGDGGSQGDPNGNGQNTNVLLGKILRLDVDNGDPYSIPAGNPFGNEIWDYGFRNPWRISFDRITNDLYIGDVGQNTWEEIDFIPAGTPGGLNFGWNKFEGNHPYSGNPSQAGVTFPVAEYSHQEGGCSVTGGYVYRGSMPEWNGIYLYADYCSGYIWGLLKADNVWQTQLLFDEDANITSFGQDDAGEIYFLSDSGEVYKLVRK